MDDILIVGASLAGLRAAETLRAEGFTGKLTILGEEEHAPYDRPPLSKEVLTGEVADDGIALPVPDGLDAHWVLGARASALDVAAREVVTEDGRHFGFDGLVIATGSAPRTLPSLADDDRIVTLRTLSDAVRLRSELTSGARLLVIGCGFIGVEVAASARNRGADVTIVSLDPPLLPAGEMAGETARSLIDAHGVRLYLGRTVSHVQPVGHARRVTLDDGSEHMVDILVMAVGAAPCTEWLVGSGLELDDGVVCDASLRATGHGAIVAAGDVARWPNPTFGGLMMRIEHWTNAVEQGAAAARALLRGDEAPAFSSVPSFWSDHFGTRLQSIGLPRLADEFRVTSGAVEDGRYAAAAYREGRLIGAITYGMPKALVKLRVELARAAGAAGTT
jgi:3-phenylpropionate/trans-cinnamate dioxygenase ferredoxin reductase component